MNVVIIVLISWLLCAGIVYWLAGKSPVDEEDNWG